MQHRFWTNIGCAILSIIGVLGAAQLAQAQQPGNVETVLAQKAERQSISLTRKFTGIFEAKEEVASVARVSGFITHVAFKEGASVKKGDLLFEIEDTVYVANVNTARANVETSEANILASEANIKQIEAKIKQIDARLLYAKQNYDRHNELFKTGSAVSKDELENATCNLSSTEAELLAAQAELLAARASLSSSKAALESAKAQLVLAEFDLSHTKVFSQIDGRTTRTTFSEGNYVTPSSGALVTVRMMDPIYVRFEISESEFLSLFGDLKNLQETAEVEIVLSNETTWMNGGNTPVKGRILFLDNQVKTSTDSLRIWIEFDNPHEKLTPGGIARVILTKKVEPSVALPHSAVMHDSKGAYVYVLDGKNKVAKRYVKLGPSTKELQSIGDSENLQETVREGEVVIIGGTHKAMPGAVVRPTFENKVLPPLPPASSAGAPVKEQGKEQTKGTKK
ncbi:MAG: efflux RND transporter periplasmic adaptor subunit [Planctomycetia bacterium]|nr:efflux RND transporter periplasmic adaptor subunit [Planctomycetia bacterium]